MPPAQEKSLTIPSTIEKNLRSVESSIRSFEKRYGRRAGSVQLLAVSKTKPIDLIEAAIAAGQFRLGESYAQELAEKSSLLTDSSLEWHFIGPIQSNKTKLIALHANWVHSIDRVKVARRLSSQRPEDLSELNVCLQVNIDREPTKSGVSPAELTRLAEAVSKLENLKLRGLMCIPKPCDSFDETRRSFSRLRDEFEQLNRAGFELDTLSMGMSSDYEAAIAEGATIVRVGTSIFGQRS